MLPPEARSPPRHRRDQEHRRRGPAQCLVRQFTGRELPNHDNVGGLFRQHAFAVDATTTLSQRGLVTPGSGALRYYSVFYRSPAATFCPPATANVTNGWGVDW